MNYILRTPALDIRINDIRPLNVFSYGMEEGLIPLSPTYTLIMERYGRTDTIGEFELEYELVMDSVKTSTGYRDIRGIRLDDHRIRWDIAPYAPYVFEFDDLFHSMALDQNGDLRPNILPHLSERIEKYVDCISRTPYSGDIGELFDRLMRDRANPLVGEIEKLYQQRIIQ